MKTSNLITSY